MQAIATSRDRRLEPVIRRLPEREAGSAHDGPPTQGAEQLAGASRLTITVPSGPRMRAERTNRGPVFGGAQGANGPVGHGQWGS